MNKIPFSLSLVTGATSGIGEAVAKLLANKGINLILCGRNEEKLKTLADELSKKVEVSCVTADLEDQAGRRKVIETIHQRAPDLVINNAGRGFYGDALTGKTEESMKLMEVNGMAVMELTLEAARTLVSVNKPGVILNVSSVAGYIIFPKFAVYAASKAFVNHLSESLDGEMSDYGIRVLAACPGMVSTNFRSRAGETEPTAEEQKHTMTPEFAAEQIWRQIENTKTINVFNWPYKILAFLAKYVIPNWITAMIVKKGIEKRIAKKEIIKIPHA
jgi:short-subunit dehydrogenase